MKVLMVIDTLEFGGAQKIFTFVANGLYERGYLIEICAYSSKESHFFVNSAIKLYLGGGYIGGRIMRHVRKISYLKDIIFESQPDIIIAFSAIPTIISILASDKGRKVVFCERLDPYQVKSIYGLAEYRFLEKYADWFIFQTEQAKEYFCERARNNSTVIPNPIEPKVKDACKLSMRRKSIVSVGRFDVKQKRQDILIEAFKIVHAKFKDWNLEFLGDGNDIQIIKKLIADNNLDNNVILHGKVKNVSEMIYDAGIFVLTSDFEGIPNALIEAMCAGLPAISTDCSPGGARLLINDGYNGILVPCRSPEKLAEKIEWMINNREEAQIMGLNAQKITALFPPEDILAIWCNTINKINEM